jgi:hypothetical protein
MYRWLASTSLSIVFTTTRRVSGDRGSIIGIGDWMRIMATGFSKSQYERFVMNCLFALATSICFWVI